MYTLEQLRNGELKDIVSLKISENLKDFPREIFELADTLEYLDLSANQLDSLPPDFGRLKKLKILFCSDNRFTILPVVLADCPELDIVGFKSNCIEFIPPKSLNVNLRWLILTNNKLKILPPAIGNCVRLQKLMLAGNKIANLPQELQLCKKLALIRVSANDLPFLPPWLYSMPSLAWIAFSGNNFNRKPDIKLVPKINIDQLILTEQLGEGASGTIYKALNKTNGTHAAVKIFKGAVTSDGYPDDEMNAYIQAGNHIGLVKLFGEVHNPVDKIRGLVMELIPPSFSNLGRPPSLDTCTRDVFPDDLKLSASQILKIASIIASVSEQLHGQGIIHGDLYAHNILIDGEGNALFGDFGAASFYNMGNAEAAFYLERIEVKAFGYLIDDLISLCDEESIADLKLLKDSCLSNAMSLRPGFREISKRLQSSISV